MNPVNKNYLLFFILIIVALEAILFSIGNHKLNTISENEEKRIIKMQNALSQVSVEAKAFSVYDIDFNREIYGKDQNEMLPLASLSKTMTVLNALADYELDHIITISPNAISQFSDYRFFINEKWKVKDLAKFTLIGSSNDGAFALAENDNNFLEKINVKARKIGMENSLFLNSTGLDIDVYGGKAGAYASAHDANIMATFAFKARPEIFSVTTLPEITLRSESGYIHKIKNTDIIAEKIPNLLFSKTGFTKLAGGNLTIIFKNKDEHRIVITVLGSSIEGRFSDMENLVNVLYNLDYES